MIGIMQGRLVPPSGNFIQEFNWVRWQEEFKIASSMGVNIIEWNLMKDPRKLNPLLTSIGRELIKNLMFNNKINIRSVNLGYLISAPIHRKNPTTNEHSDLLQLKEIIRFCSELGIRIGVLPLVKESGGDDKDSLLSLIKLLNTLENVCNDNEFVFALECELDIKLISWLAKEIENCHFLGFNFDTGNSASMGNSPDEEIYIYGTKLFNVHIKDRVLHGHSVPLGFGSVNFPFIFKELNRVGYKGNFILEAARQAKFREKETIRQYLDFCGKFSPA